MINDQFLLGNSENYMFAWQWIEEMRPSAVIQIINQIF